MKIYKILGKRGRITLPLEIRQAMGFAFNDVVSFEQNGAAVTVRREKVCSNCREEQTLPDTIPQSRAAFLNELVDGLSPEELRTALIHLSVRWAEMQSGGGGDG